MENLQKKIESVINLYKLKKYSEAELSCKNLIESNPKIAFLYNLMGIILSDQNKKEDAIIYYNKGIELNPKFALIYNNLGNVYNSQGKHEEAEELYKKSISIDDKISEPHNNLGNLFKQNNKYEEAIKHYEKAISKNHNFFWAYYNLATTYTTLGDYKKAEKFFEETLKINIFFCAAHRSLSRIKKYKINDKHLSQMLKLYTSKKIDENQKKELSFGIGKAYEDIGDFKSSYEYYKQGNSLHRKNINFSIKKEKDNFEKIKKTYDSKIIKKIDENFTTHPKIIFIVGMPRSGTTLVEQIISNHPEVFGCDELNIIPELIKKNTNILKLDKNKLLSIGNDYIKKVNRISNNSKIITDKLPINFKWIGFIKLILPNSIIIHCVRDSKDNCFSIFKTFFPSHINFSYDINEIVEFYNLYLDLMKHWDKVFPDKVFNIKYENIIKKPDDEIKRLIKLCNLTWSDKCIEFYKNRKPIKTASDTQARNKIYKTSINSWKNFDQSLGKYFKNLKN